jgi:hypothetical protein
VQLRLNFGHKRKQEKRPAGLKTRKKPGEREGGDSVEATAMHDTATKTIVQQLQLGKQRVLMADFIVRLIKNARDNNLPKMSLWDFLPTMIIMLKMFEQHECDANVSGLSRSTGIPRATLQRKLAVLVDVGCWSGMVTDTVSLPTTSTSDTC